MSTSVRLLLRYLSLFVLDIVMSTSVRLFLRYLSLLVLDILTIMLDGLPLMLRWLAGNQGNFSILRIILK